MKDQTREEPKIVAAAERQMRAWALTEETGDRTARDRLAERLSGSIGPCVTISREAGANGEHIAELVGGKLGGTVACGGHGRNHPQPLVMVRCRVDQIFDDVQIALDGVGFGDDVEEEALIQGGLGLCQAWIESGRDLAPRHPKRGCRIGRLLCRQAACAGIV